LEGRRFAAMIMIRDRGHGADLGSGRPVGHRAAVDPCAAASPSGRWRRRTDDRAVLAAIVCLTQAGCSWWKLPAALFGVSRATAYRRFTEWTTSGLWVRLHQQLLHQLGEIGKIDWSRAVVDAIAVRVERGRGDRPKPGRSRQGRFEDPRPVRPHRRRADRPDLRREHQRQPPPATPARLDHPHPWPLRTAPAAAGQAARRQGLRRTRTAHRGTPPRHQGPHRPQGNRIKVERER
jgi:transposase